VESQSGLPKTVAGPLRHDNSFCGYRSFIGEFLQIGDSDEGDQDSDLIAISIPG